MILSVIFYACLGFICIGGLVNFDDLDRVNASHKVFDAIAIFVFWPIILLILLGKAMQ